MKIIAQTGKTGLAVLFGGLFLFAAGCDWQARAAADLDYVTYPCTGEACALADDQSPPVATPFKTYTDKGAVPFSISVDGEPLIGSSPPPADDPEEFVEPGIEGVDIQVKFDGLQVAPTLNVSTMPIQRSYEAGDVVTFFTSSNYPDWITASEVRIFRRGGSPDDADVKVIVVDNAGQAQWTVPEGGVESFDDFRRTGTGGSLFGPEDLAAQDDVATAIANAKGTPVEIAESSANDDLAEDEDIEDSNPDNGSGEYEYVVRVYDAFNNYDETTPLSITRTTHRPIARTEQKEPVNAPGFADDRTGLRNIRLSGGAVTIYGRNVPRGYTVHAFGSEIPVDRDGSFVVQRILPAGEHDVAVAVRGPGQNALSFTRHVNIPSSDWFYVALADLTLGRRFQANSIVRAREEEFDKFYKRGRVAFYLKGKIQGKYLITAAADTREDDVENLVKGLDDKDPRQFLRRLDPDEFYPVYGDDSTLIEDAPTRGKFFVRIDRGPSHVMWGNFKTDITGTTFLRSERALYGAQGVYRSQRATHFGERETEVRIYAAQPRTLSQRDVLQGTGGSAYFLKRQDVTQGSETVTVEVRDTITGRVITRQGLRYGQDYEVDYIQGVVILKAPLNSFTGGSDIVQDGTLGGERLNLVVQYEYTPGLTSIKGYSYGGRAQRWFADRLRLGVTGRREQSGQTDMEMLGVDAQLRYSEKTYIDAEIAQTKGIGLRRSLSTDGGLIITDDPVAGSSGNRAYGIRLRGQIALEELLWDEMRGTIGGHYEELDAGFSSLDRSALSDEKTWGVHITTDENKKVSVTAKYDDFRSASGTVKSEGNVDVNLRLYDDLKLGIGVKHTTLSSVPGRLNSTGSRTDLGLRLTRQIDGDTAAYVFGQRTVALSGGIRRNDRGGVGGETRLTDKLGLRGEISSGSTGLGGLAGVTYDPAEDDHYYFGYRLDPDRTDRTFGSSPLVGRGRDFGAIVLGARKKIDRSLTAFAENNYDIFGQYLSLTHAYGVTYTPSESWTYTAGFEVGRIYDDVSGDFERNAVSMSIGYDDQEDVRAQLRLEGRFEDSEDGLRSRDTYLIAAGMTWSANDDWRVLTKLDAVISNSDQSSVLDGDYIEGSVGYAYRPVDNDIVNALFKYTFFYDLPGPSQENADGLRAGPLQRSHILSVDVNYDVNKELTLGAKYGFRIGEVSTSRSKEDFIRSSAHLGILRADLHIVRYWDLLLEGRILATPEAGSTDVGALFAVYRHVGENFKVGVGYNFGRFSDDLADLTQDDDGVFINAVGKF